MNALGVILARAGSKGLKDKCVRPLLGRPLIEYTFAHATAARRLCDVVLTTDSEAAKERARVQGIRVIDRPGELASDTATVDAAARHAVETWERETGRRAEAIVLLYANIPVRSGDLIDRVVEHLARTGADSVRSVAPVSKQHPDWIHRLDGDRMSQFRPNSIYRRQDLEPLFYHDGAVAAVTRAALFGALRTPDDHQSFLGRDRRAIVQRCDDAVDVDEEIDLRIAEAVLRARNPSDARMPEVGCRRREVSTVRIGDRRIGDGERPLVIAEAGVNHDGSVETALRMVDAAAAAGADAVKFQVFRADDLVTADGGLAEYQARTVSTASQRDMLRSLELSADDFRRIRERCDRRGVLFLATPFGTAELEWLLNVGVPAIKIASTDLTHRQLTTAAARSGLPLLISVGAATAAEIRDAVEHLDREEAGERLILLHCVSCYPAPLSSLNLAAIRALRADFGVPCGLSDHTQETITGALAVVGGACVLEKHLTLDRTRPGPDHSSSLEPDALREYIARAREASAAMGTGAIGFLPIEADVRRAARRSIVAACDIEAGTALADELLSAKRPGDGIAPEFLPRLIGRRAVVRIPSDTPLTWDMLR